MGFNQVENAFLATAIEKLRPQYEKMYGEYPGDFYLGNGVTFMIISDGENKGKLTIAKKVNEDLIPDPHITPADCYNLVLPGEDLATAIARVYGGRSTPYTTTLS